MNKHKTNTIYSDGKIDIHNKEYRFSRSMHKLKNNKSVHNDNKELILKFIRDCQLGKTIKGKSKKKIGYSRCIKYIDILSKVSACFNKSFNNISQIDMEGFITSLENDKIKSRLQKPYSNETKCDIKKAVKKFWKWKDGSNSNYPELVEWIDTYIQPKEIPALTKDEIEKMVEFAHSSRDKALIMVLFDSGARIEELLNVRLKKEHFFWKNEIQCYMIRLQFSKTKPRTISLPLSTQILKQWIDTHPNGDNPRSQLFPIKYDNLRQILNRIGKKVLDKRANPHLLRHSSATFYANKLNRYQLCYRYGWAMSSKEVDRYLDREGKFDEDTAKIIKNENDSDLLKENWSLRQELIILREMNLSNSKELNIANDQIDLLKNGKGIFMLIMKLIRNQHKTAKTLEELTGQKFDLELSMEN